MFGINKFTLMRKLFKPDWLKKYMDIRKERGWKGLLKHGGIKLIIGICLFYLVRDTILYGVPILLWLQGMQACSS